MHDKNENGALQSAAKNLTDKQDFKEDNTMKKETQEHAPLLKAALEYASRGWYVFPLIPKTKKPLTPRGFKDASNDATQIQKWWSHHSTANIGIATGEKSGIMVVDVDGEYPSDWPPMPATCTVKTQKGFHYYLKYPKGENVKCRTRVGGHNVDIRANGGYVVAPPSVHPDGGEYESIH